ncbi:PQQ-dependent sugar dehydrogenase [Microbacterium kribbense]
MVAVAGCSPTPGQAGPGAAGESRPLPTAEFEVLASGLDAPWSITFHGQTPLISERDSARILEITDTGHTREVAVIDGVTAVGEGGLLGIASHDEYLYVYSMSDRENRIERFALSGEPGALALGAGEVILDGIAAASYHNGGRIAFGPDGMLYATVGDAGNPASAQDLESLSGKILRLTPEGGVPQDNPFEGSLVYSYGHRNPQGIAWDAAGVMYASEFGQNTWDELNVIEAGGNYGWPEVEGSAGRDGFVDPVQQWKPADASPSGIAITSETIHIANLRGARLRDVPLADLGQSSERFTGELGRLRDVTVAPDGSLWMLTNNTDGRGDPRPDDDRVLRIDPSA